MDFLTTTQRSARMASIRGKDTKPELIVRSVAHGLGYRFRLHRRDLPGTPDLVFPRPRRVVFVHGCFWHDHCCRAHKRERVKTGYWSDKLAANVARDERKRIALEEAGWSVLTIWECETRDRERVAGRLRDFLEPHSARLQGMAPV